NRMARGREDFDRTQPGPAHVLRQPFGGALHVGSVLWERAHTGDAQKLDKLVEVLLLVVTRIVEGSFKLLHGYSCTDRGFAQRLEDNPPGGDRQIEGLASCRTSR